jgi:hypothetical protein
MGETEVKFIAVYYCSYCIFTVFRKREVERKKKEKFCRILNCTLFALQEAF